LAGKRKPAVRFTVPEGARAEAYLLKSVALNIRPQRFHGARIWFKSDHTAFPTDDFGQVKRHEPFLCPYIDANITGPNHCGDEVDQVLLVGTKIERPVHPVVGINAHVELSAY